MTIDTVRIQCTNCGLTFDGKVDETSYCPKCGKGYDIFHSCVKTITIRENGLWSNPTSSIPFAKGVPKND